MARDFVVATKAVFLLKKVRNWSGHLQWQPSAFLSPDSEEVMIQLVLKAAEEGRSIRVIGSGHSFSPLCPTDDYLLSLDNFQGIIDVNTDSMLVRVRAGTKLNQLNLDLAKHGLALENLGDIDVQSIAGAISTGTHGTGLNYGNLSTQVRALRLINGKGEVIQCSATEQPELFKAAQISLGSLGIITEITLQCVPAYRLRLYSEKRKVNELLEELEAINQHHRHFEFYWLPHTAYVMTKELNVSDEEPDKSGFKEYVQEMLLENYAFKLLCETSRVFPRSTRRLSRFAASMIGSHQKVSESYRVFSTKRIVRFNEMEYSVPLSAYKAVKQELMRWVNKNGHDILFPIENRFVKGDDIYLSPAYGRDSAYLAVHVYNKKDFRNYFTGLEEIFKAHDGRPHWGKMHTLGAVELERRYPEFNHFNQLRAEQDPEGVFLSPYLKGLLLDKKTTVIG